MSIHKRTGQDGRGIDGETKYFTEKFEDTHTEDDCDKCGKNAGKANLRPVPFLYCDCNDKRHPDVSYLAGYPEGTGYRQYYCCFECYTSEVNR